jgi:hypothetical protein
MFHCFEQSVISFGNNIAAYDHVNHRNNLLMYNASSLGGMSGGPVSKTNNEVNETPKRSRRMHVVPDQQVGYFHGIHIGGVAQLRKNFVMPVSHIAFVYQYYQLVKYAKSTISTSLTNWYTQNKEAIEKYLAPYLQDLEKIGS